MNQATTDFPAIRNSRLGHQALARLRNKRPPEEDTFSVSDPGSLLLISPASLIATAVRATWGMLDVKGLAQRVAIATGENSVALKIHAGGMRQLGSRTTGWLANPQIQTTDKFFRRRQYIGRVHDIDIETGTFTAVLNEAYGTFEQETVATFDLQMLDSKQFDQLVSGTVFTLVTGYRTKIDSLGRIVKTGLDTRLFVHEPRRLSAARREQAWRRADGLYEDE